jgi:hypothetical protein
MITITFVQNENAVTTRGTNQRTVRLLNSLYDFPKKKVFFGGHFEEGSTTLRIEGNFVNNLLSGRNKTVRTHTCI